MVGTAFSICPHKLCIFLENRKILVRTKSGELARFVHVLVTYEIDYYDVWYRDILQDSFSWCRMALPNIYIGKPIQPVLTANELLCPVQKTSSYLWTICGHIWKEVGRPTYEWVWRALLSPYKFCQCFSAVGPALYAHIGEKQDICPDCSLEDKFITWIEFPDVQSPSNFLEGIENLPLSMDASGYQVAVYCTAALEYTIFS